MSMVNISPGVKSGFTMLGGLTYIFVVEEEVTVTSSLLSFRVSSPLPKIIVGAGLIARMNVIRDKSKRFFQFSLFLDFIFAFLSFFLHKKGRCGI